MILDKLFYFKTKSLDFHIKILFLDLKIYLGSFISWIVAFLNPKNYFSLYNLLKTNSSQSILIIELNNFHSEIFPSWLFYLKRLSYQNRIFFLGSAKLYNAKPFDLISKKENNSYNFYKMDPKIILLYINLGLFKRYKKVIFNSDIFYSSSINNNYSQLSDFITKQDILKNVIFLSHLILQTIGCKNKFINPQKQIMTISPSISQDANIKYVAPIFNENHFNINKEEVENFNHKKTFISCGNIKINDKDSYGLMTALDETFAFDKKINIVGKAPKILTAKFLNHNQDIIHYNTRLSYLELKFILQKSHFILFLLSNKVSYRYKFNSSSGSFPLALNFNLIPIIEEDFAKFYCLNETNAIIYKEGFLGDAIKYACQMKYEEYFKLQSSFLSLKIRLKEASLKNIEKILL